MKYVFLAALLLLSFTAYAEEHYQHSDTLSNHKEWLKCQMDDQCVIVSGRACGYKFAVNKNYADQAKNVEDTQIICTKSLSYPSGSVAKCINNECVIAMPDQKQLNVFPPPPPPTKAP